MSNCTECGGLGCDACCFTGVEPVHWPVPLLADDDCRLCFHSHPDGTCHAMAVDPTPDGPVYSPCGCIVYVDLEAESRIVVTPDA